MIHWDDLPKRTEAARRPLPEPDDELLALSAQDRRTIAALWAERARSELCAAASFSAVAKGLFGAGAPTELLWLASRAVCDEMRHSEICLHVAEAYQGAPIPRPEPGPVVLPRLSGKAFAVLNGAVNETIGSAFLAACLDDAKSALARAALRELATDETSHARLGWAVLASLKKDDPAQKEIENHLMGFLRAGRRAWRARAMELPESIPQGHGCLPRTAVFKVVDQALRDLVLPGFAHVGIEPPEDLWARLICE